jgi:hypothetical protein
MWLTRLAFWYLPDPRFARCLGGFGPKLDPDSPVRLKRFLHCLGTIDRQCFDTTEQLRLRRGVYPALPLSGRLGCALQQPRRHFQLGE